MAGENESAVEVAPAAPVAAEVAPVAVVAAVAAPEPPVVAEAPVVVEPAVPAAEAAPAVEIPKAAELKPHTDKATLLEDSLKPEAKPVDAKVEAKPVEAKPDAPKVEAENPADAASEPAPEPVKYEFKIPDGFQVKPEAMKPYTELLAANKIAPEVGQSLIDMHTQALKEYADQSLQKQHDAFADMRQTWRTQSMADEQIGGAGWNTARHVVAQARDAFISDAQPGTDQYTKDLKAFDQFQAMTGAGDNPVWLRFLYRVGVAFREPTMPPTNAKPAPNNGKAPGRAGLRQIYEQTRSQGQN